MIVYQQNNRVPLSNWGKKDKYWVHNHYHLNTMLKRHVLFTFQKEKKTSSFSKNFETITHIREFGYLDINT